MPLKRGWAPARWCPFEWYPGVDGGLRNSSIVPVALGLMPARLERGEHLSCLLARLGSTCLQRMGLRGHGPELVSSPGCQSALRLF